MNDIINIYSKCIIKPLEEFKHELMGKYLNSFFFKKKYKKMLDDVETELLKYYEKVYEIAKEEYEFHQELDKLN